MSFIPVRRNTRATRSTKDNENAIVSSRTNLRTTSRAKSTVVATSANAGNLRITRATLSSQAKTTTNEIKEPTGAKRKREALLEVTTRVTNNPRLNPGGVDTTKTTANTGVNGAGAKENGILKPAGRKIEPLPLYVIAGKPDRTGSSTTSTKTESTSTQTNVDHEFQSEDVRMDVDEPPAKLPRLMEETRQDDFFKGHQTDDELVTEDSQGEADVIAAELEATALSSIQLWDDLDADDWDDPLMVSEYVAEVCDYLKEVEVATMPRSDYMEDQKEITWEHRSLLIDWLLQVHAKFGLLQESLFLTVNLIDRFLGLRVITLSKLQLVGLVCFFIATKYEETYVPSVKEIVELSDGLYRQDEVLKAEKYVLKTLDWDLRAPGPLGWLRRGSKADNCEVYARTIGKYLIEISCLERTLIGVAPSLISAAALWLSRLTLGREVWTPNLEHYTTYSEQELLPTASIMLEYIITDPVPHESLYKKYAHKRYKRCSLFMREWGLSRWIENGTVDLRKELRSLKLEIKEAREMMAKEAKKR